MQTEMKAGMELDSMVAIRVFDWPSSGQIVNGRPFHDVGRAGGVVVSEAIPCFSTDIAAAWKVVEKMIAGGWGFFVFSDVCKKKYSFTFKRHGDGAFDGDSNSICEAICLAALRAVEGREKYDTRNT